MKKEALDSKGTQTKKKLPETNSSDLKIDAWEGFLSFFGDAAMELPVRTSWEDFRGGIWATKKKKNGRILSMKHTGC